MGNPAEETCCYPNESNVTFPQLFVNRLSSEPNARFLASISWLYDTRFFHKLHSWSRLNPSPCFASRPRRIAGVAAHHPGNAQVAAGCEIFREGDPGDGVYFVKDGLVEISSLVNAGARRVFSQLGPGEIFGEMAVIEHRPRSATATALNDTDVYFIPRGEMLSFIQRSPALAFSLLQQISHRLREFNQHSSPRSHPGRTPGRRRQFRPLHRPRPEESAQHHRPLRRDVRHGPASARKRAPRPRSASANRSSASTTWSSDILIFTEGQRTNAANQPRQTITPLF